MTVDNHSDMQLFEQLPFGHGEASYVPVSIRVRRILRRSINDEVLVCYKRHEKAGDELWLGYLTCDGEKTEHFVTGRGDESFYDLAVRFADRWPMFRVRHRQKKSA